MYEPLNTQQVQEEILRNHISRYNRTGGKTSGELADIAYILGKDPVLMRE